MDPRHTQSLMLPDDLEVLKTSIDTLPAQINRLKELLPPPRFKAECGRILETLGRQLEHIADRKQIDRLGAEALAAKLSAVRASLK